MPETITALPGATDTHCANCFWKRIRSFNPDGTPYLYWCDHFDVPIDNGLRCPKCLEGQKELARLRWCGDMMRLAREAVKLGAPADIEKWAEGLANDVADLDD